MGSIPTRSTMAWLERRERKRGTVYVVFWRGPSGERRSKTFDRYTPALRFKSDVESQKAAGTYTDPSLGKVPLGKFARQWLDRADLRATTRDGYERWLRLYVDPGLGRKQLGSLSPAAITDWTTALLEAGTGRSTVHHAYGFLRSVLAAAVREGRIPRNPASGLRIPRPARRTPRFLTPAEVRRLADAAGEGRVLILLLAYTGLRVGEAVALRAEDVDTRGRIRVTKSVSDVAGHLVQGEPKTAAGTRSVSLPTFLLDALGDRLERGGLLFRSPTGAPLRPNNWRKRVFEPAAERAGLEPRPTIHDLRHTAAALAISAGAHPKQVQEMLGHRSVRTTMDLYGHLFEALHAGTAVALDRLYWADGAS